MLPYIKIGDISADLRSSGNLEFWILLLISHVMGWESTSEPMLTSFGGITSYPGALRRFKSDRFLYTFSTLTWLNAVLYYTLMYDLG